MKKLLKQFFSIWRGAKSLHKGIGIALVATLIFYLTFKPKNHEVKEVSVEIREELSSSQKGFELFDTNTWIKGEKELQVLEMRALKGQLEKDLATFDPIKSASVILDMAPPKSFAGHSYKTKASVILTLKPQSHLSTSIVTAITNHLAGAVHGLEPDRIAISDTTGRLYKMLGSDEGERIRYESSALESYIEEKVRALLCPLKEHCGCIVQATKDAGFIAVTLDHADKEFASQIERQLETLAAGFEIPIKVCVTQLPFEKGDDTKSMKRGYVSLVITLIFIVISLFAIYPLFRRYNKKREEETLFRVMTRIDSAKLGESIKGEDTRTIALMLSYLEPSKAEELIATFSEKMQEEVLNHLSELEYDSH